MLHWVSDQDALLSSIRDAVRPDGRFVAECGGTGNVQSIADAVNAELESRGYDPRQPWYFPSIADYASRLEAHDFEVQYATLFDRPTELDGREDGLAEWISMFGDSVFAPLSETEEREVIDAVETSLKPDHFRDGSWIADYRRLRFVAVRM